MRLKIGKKLKTASHNSKFSASYKKRLNALYKLAFILLSIVDNSDYTVYFVSLSTASEPATLELVNFVCS